MTSTLEFVANCLAAAEPVKKQKRARGGPYQGALPDRDVPVAKAIVPWLINYASEESKFRVFVESQPVVSERGLSVEVTKQWILSSGMVTDSGRMTIDFPENEWRAPLVALCRGEWTQFGKVAFKADPRCLFPEFKQQGDGVLLTWKTPLQFKVMPRFLRWFVGLLTHTEIRGLMIHPTYGEFVTGGAVSQWAFPRLVWR